MVLIATWWHGIRQSMLRLRRFSWCVLVLILIVLGNILPQNHHIPKVFAETFLATDSEIFLPFVRATTNTPTLVDGLPFNPLQTRTGDGTFYDATGAGNCSFPATPNDLMVAAMNNSDYGNSWLCGAFVEIHGPKGSVTVRIVDRCPECKPGDIDLSREAFAKIADPIAGRVPISWKLARASISTPIQYHFKEGSNQWWTAVQIRNHNTPIWKLEYRNASGQFIEVPRLQYNFFVQDSGMGPGPYTFRVTDIFGQTLTDTNIQFIEAGIVPGKAQFPAKP